MKEIIRKIDIFGGLDDKLLSKVAETATTHTWSRDEVIIREGEAGIGMYFLVRGQVAMAGSSADRQDLNAEQFLAEVTLMSLSDHKPRLASIISVTETECLLLPRDTFLRLMEKYPALSIRLARILAERLRAAQDRPHAPRFASAPAPAAAAASAAPSPEEGGGGMKADVQKKLIETFEMLYTLKAFTRFSVAILGCPVEGDGANALEVIRLGDVKAVLLPSSGRVQMGIEAYGAGEFQLHVFHPSRFAGGPPRALRFDPVPIQPNDRFTLTLPDAVLTRLQNIAPEAGQRNLLFPARTRPPEPSVAIPLWRGIF